MINKEVLINNSDTYILKTSNLNNELILFLKINKNTREYSLFDSNFELILTDFIIHIEYTIPYGKRIEDDIEYSNYRDIKKDTTFVCVDTDNVYVKDSEMIGIHSIPFNMITKLYIVGDDVQFLEMD